MADSETQQVTSQTPATKQKNPKRVAAGKLIAEKTKQAREAQKKALIEAKSIIANNQTKVAPPGTPSADPPAVSLAEPESTKKVLTTTQWLSVISIVVSLAGIYYKREEIKGLLTKKPPQDYTPPPQDYTPPPQVHTLPPVPPNSPVDFAPKRGIKPMD